MRTPLLALTVAAALLAGCSSGSDESAGDTGSTAAAGGGAEVAADSSDPGLVDLRAVPGAAVVRTAEVGVRVADVAAAADEAGRRVRTAGGTVTAEDRSGGTGPRYAVLRLRVPPAQLDRLVGELAALGEETGRRLGSEDVTEQVVDLEARLATQRASVDRVRALLAQATALGEVVQVEAELTKRTADLEALQARLAALDAQVDLATVDLTLEQREGAAAGELGPLDGLRGGWSALLTAGRLLAVAGGAALPFLPLLLLGALVVRRLRRPAPGTA